VTDALPEPITFADHGLGRRTLTGSRASANNVYIARRPEHPMRKRLYVAAFTHRVVREMRCLIIGGVGEPANWHRAAPFALRATSLIGDMNDAA
jgi:hypothetical protein